MGMYTELYLGVELKKETPEAIRDWLVKGKTLLDASSRIKTYPFGGTSYYFDALTIEKMKYDTIANSYYFTGRMDLKNYENEIQFILNTLEPYIISDGHIGHVRYEEEEMPTILIMNQGKIKWKTYS